MKRHFPIQLVLITALCLIVVPVEGAGWYNLPISPCQCLGYGYGPGYHAPMVLGSPLASGSETKRLIRKSCAPVSPVTPVCEFGAPSAIPMMSYPSHSQQVPTLAPGNSVENNSGRFPAQQPQQVQQPATASRGWNLRW